MLDPGDEQTLHQIVDAMLGRSPKDALVATLASARQGPPFDVSARNQHESKKDFLAEKRTLEQLAKNLEEISSVLPHDEVNDPQTRKTIENIRGWLNAKAKEKAPATEIDHPLMFIVKNALDMNIFYSFLMLNLEVRLLIKERLQELADQEREFWSNSHRAPNYRARTIALRLARI